MGRHGTDKSQKNGDKTTAGVAREERLKQALRKNLHRRKSQSRARDEAVSDGAEEKGQD